MTTCRPLSTKTMHLLHAGEITVPQAFAQEASPTPSALPPGMLTHFAGVSGTARQYRRVARTANAHGPAILRDLVATHDDLVETRTDWSDCQKSARRLALVTQWQAVHRLTVIIPARNEDQAEVDATVASWLAAGAAAIIVIDDGSDIPLAPIDGARLIRHTQALGPAHCRNLGADLAETPVIAWSDAHVRVRSSGLPNWIFQASTCDDILCACCESRDSLRRFYGASLAWDPARRRYKAAAHASKHKTVDALYGSVYACRQTTWERFCGWPPTVGWGYNEQALSLACQATGVQMICTPRFVCSHLFRRRFPYTGTSSSSHANREIIHSLFFHDTAPGPEWAPYLARLQAHRILSPAYLAARNGGGPEQEGATVA